MKLCVIFCFLFAVGIAGAVDPLANFPSTNIQQLSTLNQAFKGLWKGRKRSECYDRAHFWSYQMFKEFGIKSTKVFVFFTNKYKREIFGQWWFHVAPGVIFQNEEYIMDPEFLKNAVNFETWKNGVLDHAIYKLTPIKVQYEQEINNLYHEISTSSNLTQRERRRISYVKARIQYLEDELERMLISNVSLKSTSSDNWSPSFRKMDKIVNLNCVNITNYSEYVNDQDNVYCYIIRSSMYYRAPMDVELLEKQQRYQYDFEASDLFEAHRRAFGGRFPYQLPIGQ